jgi:hypothetical protein
MALTATHLRLESPDGVEVFRISDGRVEARQLQHDSSENNEWHRLDPDQIADHVNRNTVVAQWLMRRLGWRRLLRASIKEESVH